MCRSPMPFLSTRFLQLTCLTHLLFLYPCHVTPRLSLPNLIIMGMLAYEPPSPYIIICTAILSDLNMTLSTYPNVHIIWVNTANV